MDNALICNIRNSIRLTLNNLQSLKYYKYFCDFIEYLKNLEKKFKELSDLKFASFSYIPLFGWILPMVMRNNNPYCKYHAKQGFFLSFVFITTAIALYLINIFTPREFRDFRLGIVIGIYFIYLCYLILCIIAASIVSKGKEFKIFLIRRLADYIEL